MTYSGHVRNGQVVLDDPVTLPEGTKVKVDIVADLPKAKESAAHDSVLARAKRLDEVGRTDTALDMLYDFADQMMRQEQFEQLDAMLAKCDVSSLSADILLGVLTATLPAKNRLGARPRLYQQVEKVLQERGEYEEGLLAGLEN